MVRESRTLDAVGSNFRWHSLRNDVCFNPLRELTLVHNYSPDERVPKLRDLSMFAIWPIWSNWRRVIPLMGAVMQIFGKVSYMTGSWTKRSFPSKCCMVSPADWLLGRHQGPSGTTRLSTQNAKIEKGAHPPFQQVWDSDVVPLRRSAITWINGLDLLGTSKHCTAVGLIVITQPIRIDGFSLVRKGECTSLSRNIWGYHRHFWPTQIGNYLLDLLPDSNHINCYAKSSWAM